MIIDILIIDILIIVILIIVTLRCFKRYRTKGGGKKSTGTRPPVPGTGMLWMGTPKVTLACFWKWRGRGRGKLRNSCVVRVVVGGVVSLKNTTKSAKTLRIPKAATLVKEVLLVSIKFIQIAS